MKKIATLLIGFLFILSGSQPVFAQQRTDSNMVTTKVGNPVSTTSTIASAAMDLATTVGAACGGKVQGANISCLQGLSFSSVSYPDSAIQQLSNSALAYYCKDSDPSLGTCLQCVGFVQAAVMGATGSVLNNGGNAKDYATKIPSGYQYYTVGGGTDIQEGDIIIKTGGDFGHIAVVVQVYSQTAIKVAEANFNYGGEVGTNDTATALWQGFLRKQ
ncbi:MAG: CHAP domain-containing protein [Candidatus Levyibacteriota bacterium]